MRDEETIFAEALNKAPEQRSAFLDQACADSPELRHEVEALLVAHERTNGILESPPAGVEATSGRAEVVDDTLFPPEQPGCIVGPYKLLEQIGEGGMGVVYMAEQLRPVRRRVALKIIRPGLDTKQVIARLEAERQALAMMDHPSIAKVFDAGATDAGRPYFVMELVRGIPITEYCDQNQLTPRQRLELFVQVCQAVQHAHQKGIIHRDLKPSNVLVTLNDGKPTPKIIDFGIAKATAGNRLTEQTLFTEFRQLIGTPLYMSPEQAEMRPLLDVDTRSDVYSLGVLLYELLTGTTPFDKERLAKAAYDEVRRIIREEEPPKPSTRVSTLGQTLMSVCTDRGTDQKRLNQLVRGELDWIVMRALEKDRTRRYETADGLARDVERYLTDQPVEAVPPSAGYKLRKFARKYRVPLSVAAGFVAVLLGASVVSSWQAIRATRATARETAQRNQADAVAGLLESVFQRLDPFAEQKGGLDLKSQLVAELDQTAVNLDRDYVDRPVRARLRNALGTTLLGLGETAKATALFESALAEQRADAQPDDPQVLDTLSHLAAAYFSAGRFPDAIKLFEKVRDQRVKRLGPDHLDTLDTLGDLATAYEEAGRTDEAIRLLEQVRDQQIKRLGIGHPKTLSALNNLGEAYRSAGRTADAIKLYEQLREREIKVLGPDHPFTLTTLNNLGEAYRSGGRTDEAIKLFEQVRNQQIKTLGPDHPSTLATTNNLALAYQNAGRTAEAIQLYEQVRDQCVKKLGPDHPHTLATLNNLASAYQDAGRLDEAIKLHEEVRNQHVKKLGPNHPDTLTAQNNLACDYAAAGRLPEAIKILEQVRDLRTQKLGADHPQTVATLGSLAQAYQSAGRIDEAIKLFELVRDRQVKDLGPDHPSTLLTLNGLAYAYQSAGRTDEAIKLYERVRDQQIKKLGADHPDTLRTQDNLASAYQDARRFPEAIKLFEHVRDQRVKALGPDHPDTIGTLNSLALIYTRTGRTAEGLKLYQRLREHEAASTMPSSRPKALGSGQ